MTIENQLTQTILAIYCVLMMVGCDQSADQNQSSSRIVKAEIQAKHIEQTAIVYSCDNSIIRVEGSAPCFPPDDPKYMTIALRSRPPKISEFTIRFPDPGEGVTAKVLDQQEWLDNVWYKVEAQDHIGWIAEHLIILDSK